jgi:hypothetical protein
MVSGPKELRITQLDFAANLARRARCAASKAASKRQAGNLREHGVL